MLPGTVQALTGGGGLHLLYAHPGVPLKSCAHSLGPGLDIKADGGQIVAPPSLHPSGRRYRWLGDVWQVPLTPWPDALLPVEPEAPRPVLTVERSAPCGRRLAGLVQLVMDAQPGERNARLFWAACRGAELVADGAPETAVTDALLLAAEAVGLDRRGATATLRSGLRRQAAA